MAIGAALDGETVRVNPVIATAASEGERLLRIFWRRCFMSLRARVAELQDGIGHKKMAGGNPPAIDDR